MKGVSKPQRASHSSRTKRYGTSLLVQHSRSTMQNYSETHTLALLPKAVSCYGYALDTATLSQYSSASKKGLVEECTIFRLP